MTESTDGKDKGDWDDVEDLKPAVGVRLVKGCGMPGP